MVESTKLQAETERSSPRVYIILLNWNGFNDTITCLDSLLKLEYEKFKIVVCDNASSDGSIDKIVEWAEGKLFSRIGSSPVASTDFLPPRKPVALQLYDRLDAENGGDLKEEVPLVLVRTGANLGFAGGCNVGIRYALARGDADFVWLLNNDTVVEKNALTELVAIGTSDAGIGITGSTLCLYDTPGTVQALGGGTFNPGAALSECIGFGERHRQRTEEEVVLIEQRMQFVVGASMLVSRRFLDSVGLMEEDYFLYFEELDWAERAKRLIPPLRMAFASQSIVYHKVGASIGSYSSSLVSVRYFTRNRLEFLKRYYPAYIRSARFRLAREAVGASVRGRWRAAQIILKAAIFGKTE